MDNIKWIFSGIGVTVLVGVLNFIYRKKNNVQYTITNIYEKEPLELVPNMAIESVNTEDFINPIFKLYDRIIQIFIEHNIPIQQIPKFADPVFDIGYSDLQSKESFIRKITPEFIDWISLTFNVTKDWIEDRSEYIYRTVDAYKYPISFRDLIVEIIKEYQMEYSYSENINIYIFKEDIEFKADETEEYRYVQFIVQVKIMTLNNTPIYKYYIIRNNLYWDYWKCRRDSKIIITICKALNITMHGYTQDHNVLSNIGAGCEFPEKYIKMCRGYTWYPEDYISNFKIHQNEVNDYSLNDIDLKEIISDTRRVIEELRADFHNRV